MRCLSGLIFFALVALCAPAPDALANAPAESLGEALPRAHSRAFSLSPLGRGLTPRGNCLGQSRTPVSVNRAGQANIQTTLNDHTSHTYNLATNPSDTIAVTIDATYLPNFNNMIRVYITNDAWRNVFVLSNYENARATTPRHTLTIEVDSWIHNQDECIDLPTLDGIWYVQKSR